MGLVNFPKTGPEALGPQWVWSERFPVISDRCVSQAPPPPSLASSLSAGNSLCYLNHRPQKFGKNVSLKTNPLDRWPWAPGRGVIELDQESGLADPPHPHERAAP